MDGRSRRDLPRLRSVPIVMARTISFPPAIPNLRSSNSMFRLTCAKCHQGVEQEFMQSIHGQAIARGNSTGARAAPIATAFIPSRPTSTRIRWYQPEHALALPVRAAMKAFDFLRNSVLKGGVLLRTWRAITDLLPSSGPQLWPIAPAATACITFCLPAMPVPPSTAPTLSRLAANATPASPINSCAQQSARRRAALGRYWERGRALDPPLLAIRLSRQRQGTLCGPPERMMPTTPSSRNFPAGVAK